MIIAIKQFGLCCLNLVPEKVIITHNQNINTRIEMISTAPAMQIHLFPCLNDNYAFLLHDPENRLTAVIDTPEVSAINRALNEKGWELTHILNTHHHWDHAGGNLELKEQTGCMIVGPRAEAGKIPGIDIEVGEGETFQFGNYLARIFDTPGHTSGHIIYFFESEHCAFVGDTLFAMGCGRLFEGTPGQMWHSLQKIMALPDDTKLYCAHEYTQTNGRFALTVDPDNKDLIKRMSEVNALREKGTPTIPTDLALEKKTNPFLRPGDENIRMHLHMQNNSTTEVFARIREMKDNFRS